MAKYEILTGVTRRIVEADKMFVSNDCIHLTTADNQSVAIIPVTSTNCVSKLDLQSE